MSKPSIPKGTRDFSPVEMQRRNYIFDCIRETYGLFGFEQIETPAMENLSTLEGKYGEEGDKLLFRILNSGPVLENIRQAANEIKMPGLTEKGLRYDLTVPFARYVVMHRNEIDFPFKRYQIQPVWRADRPQKGRYREFFQCDADVIGSNSLMNEVDLLSIIDTVFEKLKIKVDIKLNNRKILAGIAEIIGAPEKIIDLTVAIDKLDKIGFEKVVEELKEKGLSQELISLLEPIILMKGNNEEKLATLKNILRKSETGMKGIEETEFILHSYNDLDKKTVVDVDVTLARGLNYYTGAIIEVKVNDANSTFTSSVCGGGRYDDLTGIFGLPDVSGVGISFGADRIYDVLEEMNAFPSVSSRSTKILFANFGEKEAAYCNKLASRFRDAGIQTEVYPEAAKIKKQMSYADSKKILFVALIGSEEMKNGMITVKDMNFREQFTATAEQLLQRLSIS
jgi:histidyl-tRNA synthetase